MLLSGRRRSVQEAVQRFGRERGRRIARRVSCLCKPLSLKNWLIYTDIDAGNFAARPRIDNGDLVAAVGECAFDTSSGKADRDFVSSPRLLNRWVPSPNDRETCRASRWHRHGRERRLISRSMGGREWSPTPLTEPRDCSRF